MYPIYPAILTQNASFLRSAQFVPVLEPIDVLNRLAKCRLPLYSDFVQSKEDLTRTEEGIPCEADDKVLIGSCRSYSPPGSLVLVGVVSPLELTPLKLKQTVCLSPLSSTLPPSHVATMSLSLSPLSTITSTTHMSPTGCDSYDDDLPLFPQEEMHF